MASRIGVVFLAGLTLAGCGLLETPADRAVKRSPSFRAGYSDGCAAASSPSANPRDAQASLAGEDKLYRRGYSAGLSSCRPTGVAPGSAPYDSRPGDIHVPG